MLAISEKETVVSPKEEKKNSKLCSCRTVLYQLNYLPVSTSICTSIRCSQLISAVPFSTNTFLFALSLYQTGNENSLLNAPTSSTSNWSSIYGLPDLTPAELSSTRKSFTVSGTSLVRSLLLLVVHWSHCNCPRWNDLGSDKENLSERGLCIELDMLEWWSSAMPTLRCLFCSCNSRFGQFWSTFSELISLHSPAFYSVKFTESF